MKIPLLDLQAQYQNIGPEIRKAIDEVLELQQFILGAAVKKFEQQASAYLKCKHAIGVASGSDALLLALSALGIGFGHALLTTPFTFFATASAISRVGARPIFFDIDPSSYLMDTNQL